MLNFCVVFIEAIYFFSENYSNFFPQPREVRTTRKLPNIPRSISYAF